MDFLISQLNLDLILFGSFLALNLILGLKAGLKVKNIQDFAIGNKTFSTGAVTSTIVATWIGGGSMFYALQNIYTDGFRFVIVLLGGTFCLLFTGQVLAVRMGEFLNNLSVAEAMGNLYGKSVRIITAISGIAGMMGAMAVQFQVIGKMLSILLGFKGFEVTVTAATIVILYSAFGGIRSVTITDIFQFITFSIFIPILALIIWNQLKTPDRVIHTLQHNPLFSLRSLLKLDKGFFFAISLMLYFIIPGLKPSIFQRISIAKDTLQVKKSFTYAAFIHGSVFLSLAFITVLLFTSDSQLDPKKLVDYIIDQYSHPGLKGLIAVGIVAMAMSTADSYLNSAAVLMVNDFIKPIWPKYKITITKLRVATVLIGLIGLVIALYIKDILELLLLSSGFYMPIVTVPLLMAIFGFRPATRCVLIGMLAGLITVVVCMLFFKDLPIDKLIPGMLANLTFLIGSHYILRQPGGWVGIKDKAPLLAARQARKAYWKAIFDGLKEIRVYAYLQKNLPGYDIIYTLFGLYVLGATYSLFFTIPEEFIGHYQPLYDVAAHSVLICTAAFLTYPAWPPTFRAKWFITYAWPMGVCYVLFVVGAQLVIMSEFHYAQVMIFLLNLVLAALLFSWPLMLLLSTGGTFLGSLVFHIIHGPIHLTGALESLQFNFIYGILLSSTFLLAIFVSKQKMQYGREKYSYLEKNYQDNKAEFLQVLKYSETALKEMMQTEGLLNKTAVAYTQQIIYRIKDYMRLQVTQVTVDQLIAAMKTTLKLRDLKDIPQLVVEKNTSIPKINIDVLKVQEMLVNSLLMIQANNPLNKPIQLFFEESLLGYSVNHIKNYTKQLEALKISLTLEAQAPEGPTVYTVAPLVYQENTSLIAEEVEKIRVIDAHYGYGKVLNPTTYVYVLPINVREVRGKVMELLREPAAAVLEELKHPMAITLEKELLDKLQDEKVDLTVIHKALDTIKKYHAGVKRKSGEPFFTHPIAVALILLQYCQDQDAIVAALLHDTVEDTSLSTMQVRTLFGDSVAFMVGKVTNLEDNLRRMMLEDHENTHRLMNYEDKRAVYVKLADRMHNMRTIQGHSSLEKQKHIANETLNFFVPMAKELGLEKVAEELETLSLEVLGKKR